MQEDYKASAAGNFPHILRKQITTECYCLIVFISIETRKKFCYWSNTITFGGYIVVTWNDWLIDYWWFSPYWQQLNDYMIILFERMECNASFFFLVTFQIHRFLLYGYTANILLFWHRIKNRRLNQRESNWLFY